MKRLINNFDQQELMYIRMKLKRLLRYLDAVDKKDYAVTFDVAFRDLKHQYKKYKRHKGAKK